MKIISLSFTGMVLLSFLSFTFCASKATKKETKPVSTRGFAVVELFTSEGCSSCPPADEAIIKLAKEFPEHVYFLGYHVDYWNYIGWKDEFSNADYTNRQNKYAGIFNLNSIYTPQAIVNGEKEMVGSRESQLRTTIQQALEGATSSTIELSAKKTSGQNIVVSYKIVNTSDVLLTIALVQLKATSDVKRGENKGHQLNHINVVRDLKVIGTNKSANSAVDLKIPSGLLAKDVKVIAFVQNRDNMKIMGATETFIQ